MPIAVPPVTARPAVPATRLPIPAKNGAREGKEKTTCKK